MGCGPSSSRVETNEIECANGRIRKGIRVQTQWDEGSGHDNKWYCGTVDAVYQNREAKVVYDDGDTWTGEAVYIYALPPEHPGITQKFAIGADTMAGVAGANGPSMGLGAMPVQMGQPMPMMAQPMMAQPIMAQPMMVPPQQPGMQVLSVTCPPGAGAGSMITVQGPAGPMEVQVPMGVFPGQEFQFQAPASGPQVAMAQPVGQPQVVMGMPM